MRKIRFLLFLVVTLAAPISMAGDSGEVAASANDICPIKLGVPIPDVTLHDIDGKPFVLRDALAKQPAVLIIYRGSW